MKEGLTERQNERYTCSTCLSCLNLNCRLNSVLIESKIKLCCSMSVMSIWPCRVGQENKSWATIVVLSVVMVSIHH